MEGIRLVTVLVAAAVALGGCGTVTLSDATARLRALDAAVVEPEVDAAVDTAIDVLCKMPLDTTLRAADRRGPGFLEARMAECPEMQRLRQMAVDDMLRDLAGKGMKR